MAKALVITPTTGAPELADAVRSVQQQTYPCDHLLVIDGPDFEVRTREGIANVDSEGKTFKCVLPFNTGANGFYGHRIMAGFSHLVNHDYIIFLDQDNWFESDHVETLVNEIDKYNFDWAYSLRRIVDKDKKYICDDDCESLGRWPAWVADNVFLIDSSSYCFKRDFFRQVGHIWDFGWGADRRFYSVLKDHFKHNNYGCTGKATLNYRLGGNPGSVTAAFFDEGNKKMQEKYFGSNYEGARYPWRQRIK